MPEFSEETIHIVDLEVRCTIGVHPEERTRKQPLVVNASYRQNFAAAAEGDRIGDTVDYSRFSAAIREFVENSRFELLETLIRRLALHLAGQFPVRHLTLHIRKPQAIAGAAGAAVSLTLADGSEA